MRARAYRVTPKLAAADRIMRRAAAVAEIAESEALQSLIIKARALDGEERGPIVAALERARKIAQERGVSLMFASGRAA